VLPKSGPNGSSLTGLFSLTWHPKKSVTVLWRRVETLSPAAYDEVMAWARDHAGPGESWRWLEAMATNEVAIEVAETLAELHRLIQRWPPEPIRAHAQLLWDLIWEASEPANDWLHWHPCRLCGRRWAVATYEGVPLCPRHQNSGDLIAFLRQEMARYPGLVDHSATLAVLEARQHQPTPPARPSPLPDTTPAAVTVAGEPPGVVGVGRDGDE
jgi:hypothetical protein